MIAGKRNRSCPPARIRRQNCRLTAQRASEGRSISTGNRALSFAMPAHWPLGRSERPMARGRMFGIAMTLSRYSSTEWRAKRQTLPFCDCGVFVPGGVSGRARDVESWTILAGVPVSAAQRRNTAVPPRLLAARLLRSARGARVDVPDACWPLLLGCVGGGRPTCAINRRFDAAADFPAAGNASCQEPAEGGTGSRQGSHQIRVRIGSTEGNSAPEGASSAADSTS
jgi:hypothetical protein